MVELPDAYYTVVVHGDYDWEIRMSTYAIPGYTKFDKQYVSAYEAYSDGTTLFSRKGQTPTVSKNRDAILSVIIVVLLEERDLTSWQKQH